MRSEYSDFETLPILLEAMKEENLVNLIVQAHLLLERALERQIAGKSARVPRTFSEKLSRYFNLIKPPEKQKRLLFAFNKLRNKIAHQLEGGRKCVWDCLPWEGGQESKLDVQTYVGAVALGLLIDLGEIKAADIEGKTSDKRNPNISCKAPFG
jgi:hypothetical protein